MSRSPMHRPGVFELESYPDIIYVLTTVNQAHMEMGRQFIGYPTTICPLSMHEP